MVIGRGDIASALKDLDRDDFIFFASGVSDSQCVDHAEFNREMILLLTQPRHEHIVYFSSLSIFDKDTAYTKHKLRLEACVKGFDNFTIIRLGNIAWGNNPKTIINYFRNAIKNNEPVVIKDEYKYICTLEDFRYWIGKIPDFNCELNITGERIHAKELYERLRNS